MKYFIKEDGNLKPVTEYKILTYGYYLGGFQDPAEAGVLNVMHYDNKGTCLVPVFDQDGLQVIDIAKAGKDYKETV